MTDSLCSRSILPGTQACEVPQRDKRNDLRFAEEKKKEAVVHKAVILLIVRDFVCFSSIILFTRCFGKLRYDLTSILTGSNLSYGVSWALAVGGEKTAEETKRFKWKST